MSLALTDSAGEVRFRIRVDLLKGDAVTVVSLLLTVEAVSVL
jgi:hypothetical protein